jgi:hypothetical protein
MWEVKDVVDPGHGESYYIREVFLKPKVLFLHTVSPQLAYKDICDPWTTLCTRFYDMQTCFWDRDEATATYFYVLSSEGKYFRDKCITNHLNRKQGFKELHPDKVGNLRVEEFLTELKCYGMEKDITQELMMMLHFVPNSNRPKNSVRANIVPNTNKIRRGAHISINLVDASTPNPSNSSVIFRAINADVSSRTRRDEVVKSLLKLVS